MNLTEEIKMSISRIPGVFSLLLLSGFMATHSQALQLLTEEYPPFSYTQNKQVKGMSTEVVTEIGRRAQIPMEISVVTWTDAYQAGQSKRDTCIYSTARLGNRERIFKWVGPLAVNAWGLFAKDGFNGKIQKIADARPYRIGGVTEDAKVEWLKQQAVTNIVTVKDEKLIPRMLTLDRKQQGAVDLWIASVYAAKTIADEANVKDLKLVLKAGEQHLWLACNPGVPDTTIKALSEALDAMKKDGTYNKISATYDKQFAR